jgi:6-phosphogluconolactonase
VLSPERYVQEAAAALAAHVSSVVREHGECRLGLSGGGTPQPIYRALAAREDVDWSRIRFFFGDERSVGPEDDRSNYKMVREALLDPVGAAPEHVARIQGERPPAEARDAYEHDLGDRPLHVLLLGMGGDGHTASLFPGQPLNAESDARVLVTQSPVAPTTRISLSLRAINEAAQVILLVAGGGKAARLAEVWRQMQSDAPVLPAAHVHPQSERLQWIVDRDAAAELPESHGD